MVLLSKMSIVLLLPFFSFLPNCFGTQLNDAVYFHGRIIPLISVYEYNFLTTIVKFQNTSDGTPRFVCGGVLIHPFWIITAASCFGSDQNISNYHIYAGQRGFHKDQNHGQRRQIYELKTHNGCLPLEDECSIALIRVDYPFNLTDKVRPALLSFHNMTANTECIMLSVQKREEHGEKIVISKMRSYAVIFENCYDILRALENPLMHHLHEVNYCLTITEDIDYTILKNESVGFPSMCDNLIQGIVSSIGDDDELTIAIDIGYHLEWIQNNMVEYMLRSNNDQVYLSAHLHFSDPYFIVVYLFIIYSL